MIWWCAITASGGLAGAGRRKARWQRWAKGRYPGLSAQSTQQLIGEFCEAVDSCRQLRKNGQAEARYPWRKPRYHDVVYTNQDARMRDGRLICPMAQSGTLRIRAAEHRHPAGRLMEVRLSYGVVRLVCEVADAPRPQQTVIGVDLGVNTLIAATDGTKVVLVSGRGVKATIQWRNKTLADIQRAAIPQDQRLAPLEAPATPQVSDARQDQAPGAGCHATRPRTHGCRRSPARRAMWVSRSTMRPSAPGRVQAQQVSTACTRKIIQQLDYKTAGAITLSEAYSSQTCPVCGERSKHRRIYRCPTAGPPARATRSAQ